MKWLKKSLTFTSCNTNHFDTTFLVLFGLFSGSVLFILTHTDHTNKSETALNLTSNIDHISIFANGIVVNNNCQR